jgi:hypothetical protein
VILHDTATAFITIIDRATLAVEALAAALAVVLCVIGFCAAPLIASRTRRTVKRPPAPVRRRVPSWAHTQPRNYDPAA